MGCSAFFQVDIVTANTYYDILYNWMRLKKLIDDQNRNELGDYYENHKEWPTLKRYRECSEH